MSKQIVQSLFGASADAYVTSSVHAKGASLHRLVELLRPQPDWRVLDLATGAGHAAFTLAPLVASVVATDITPQMLQKTAVGAQERGLTNLSVETADVDDLPFGDQEFDVVTCRIAAHHFPDIGRFLAEAARVIKENGRLAIVDNIVPGSRLRGKKAQVQREAGRYVNAFEKLRDPGHGRCLSLDEWMDAFVKAGLALDHAETLRKEMDFASWTDRMHVSDEDRIRLRVMLLQAPTAVAEFLTPVQTGDRIAFYLTEAILIGRLGTGD